MCVYSAAWSTLCAYNATGLHLWQCWRHVWMCRRQTAWWPLSRRHRVIRSIAGSGQCSIWTSKRPSESNWGAFLLSPVISFSWSIIKVKPRACGTRFRPFDNCHLKQQTLNWCQAVRRHALCNEINGCLWKGGSCWHKLSATCFAIKAVQQKSAKKQKQTVFIIMFSHWLEDSYRVMFKPINTQTSCKNRQKNTSKQHSWLYPEDDNPILSAYHAVLPKDAEDIEELFLSSCRASELVGGIRESKWGRRRKSERCRKGADSSPFENSLNSTASK